MRKVGVPGQKLNPEMILIGSRGQDAQPQQGQVRPMITPCRAVQVSVARKSFPRSVNKKQM